MGHLKTINFWKCDNCGLEAAWGKDWRSRLIAHPPRHGMSAYDEELVVCSDECQNELDKKRAKKKKKAGNV